MAGELLEDIRLFLPRYLNPEHQAELFEAIKQFPENKDYYLGRQYYQHDLLQGDGWRGFVAINFHSGERKTVTGLVLSNTCDIDIKNPRDADPNIIFVPLIRLARFKQTLLDAGKAEADVMNKVDAIRSQRSTSIFYLPELPEVIEESMVLLDDLHQHPLSHFHATDKSKVFTLNQYAFYLFLVKLSIHFTRFSEDLSRYPAASNTPDAV